jgi:hypothetical protein
VRLHDGREFEFTPASFCLHAKVARMEVKHTQCMAEWRDANAFQVPVPQPT